MIQTLKEDRTDQEEVGAADEVGERLVGNDLVCDRVAQAHGLRLLGLVGLQLLAEQQWLQLLYALKLRVVLRNKHRLHKWLRAGPK